MTTMCEVVESKDSGRISNIWSNWMKDMEDDETNYKIYWENLINNIFNISKVYLLQEDDIVGLIAGCVVTTFSEEKVGCILHLYITPEKRGTNGYLSLLHKLQDWFKAEGITSVLIELGRVEQKLEDQILKHGYKCISKIFKRKGVRIL